MTYDFFADKEDKLSILDFIFTNTDLRNYDLSSQFGKEISEYKTVQEISSKFDFIKGAKFAITFQLWSPRHNGKPGFRKIALDPKRCNGHTFRYSTTGLGLIQLYFGGQINNELNQSHIGHFNEKEAVKWQGKNSFNELSSSWDWAEIGVTLKEIKQYIQKLATRRIGGFDVLPGAERLEQQGVKLK